MEIITFDELRNPNDSVEFEGADHGGAGASFFVLDFERGRGPGLHTHAYAEICILLEGQATFHGPDGDA
jgi:quercetin dioxygenase-like cupin family protein